MPSWTGSVCFTKFVSLKRCRKPNPTPRRVNRLTYAAPREMRPHNGFRPKTLTLVTLIQMSASFCEIFLFIYCIYFFLYFWANILIGDGWQYTNRQTQNYAIDRVRDALRLPLLSLVITYSMLIRNTTGLSDVVQQIQ